jgi:hypothetical protein
MFLRHMVQNARFILPKKRPDGTQTDLPETSRPSRLPGLKESRGTKKNGPKQPTYLQIIS